MEVVVALTVTQLTAITAVGIIASACLDTPASDNGGRPAGQHQPAPVGAYAATGRAVTLAGWPADDDAVPYWDAITFVDTDGCERVPTDDTFTLTSAAALFWLQADNPVTAVGDRFAVFAAVRGRLAAKSGAIEFQYLEHFTALPGRREPSGWDAIGVPPDEVTVHYAPFTVEVTAVEAGTYRAEGGETDCGNRCIGGSHTDFSLTVTPVADALQAHLAISVVVTDPGRIEQRYAMSALLPPVSDTTAPEVRCDGGGGDCTVLWGDEVLAESYVRCVTE